LQFTSEQQMRDQRIRRTRSSVLDVTLPIKVLYPDRLSVCQPMIPANSYYDLFLKERKHMGPLLRIAAGYAVDGHL
jgi:hypothetical protein